jgi:flagellar basal-body rod modification protein FlgD
MLTLNPVTTHLQSAASQSSSTAGTTSGTTSGSSTSGTTLPASLTSESTFLQLLVAQIQNQDPLNPTDSIQFISQLVQFSQLEQEIGINQGVQTLVGDVGTTSSTNPKQPAGTGS